MNTIQKAALVAQSLFANNPDKINFCRKDIEDAVAANGFKKSVVYALTNPVNRVGHGVYSIEGFLSEKKVMPVAEVKDTVPAVPVEKTKVARGVATVAEDIVYTPAQNDSYVKPPQFKDINTVIKSRMFYPMFVSGPSGTGKTEMIEQVCAANKRNMVRVQVTEETDRDSLLGGMRLIDGETVFQEGPVTVAAKRGYVLLVDEFDRATNKLMALQGVLEGKPFVLPYTGEVVVPHPDFTVIATGNTKGRGSESGRYSGARIIDDSLLERFNDFVDLGHPTIAQETKILVKFYENVCGKVADDDFMNFISKLTLWAKTIRDTYAADGIDDEISTRRMLMIVKSFSIFGDRLRAIRGACAKFEKDVEEAFIDLYTKVDEGAITDEGDAPEQQ